MQLWPLRGAADRHANWLDEVKEALRTAVPQIPVSVLDGPPTIESLQDENPALGMREVQQLFLDSLAVYQIRNNWGRQRG